MTREIRLQYCKVCAHQKKDLNLGIICGLRGTVADFEAYCPSFEEDALLKEKMRARETEFAVEGKLASQGQRFANYLVDQVFLVGFGLIIGSVIGIILAYVAPEYLYIFEYDNRLMEYGLGMVLGFIYFSFFEGFTGRSLGKFFTKTKVVTENGERPDFRTIFVRSLCRYIPFNAFSFLGSDPVGWHDSLSKTRVVQID
ncbi:MAG: RDD family protein [Bacteroidota bacterium]